jgi:hypothetical protein
MSFASPHHQLDRARVLIESGQLEAAINATGDALACGPPSEQAFQLLLIRTEAHRQLGQIAHAIDALSTAVELFPENENALERLTNLTAMVGHRDARRYRTRLLALQAKGLPARLSDGLKALWETARARPLNSLEMDWAWELADKPLWAKADWQVAATWGHDASRYLRRWWDSLPDKVDQIDELLDAPDLEPIAAAAHDGRPCLLVGAHVGPVSPGLKLLQSAFRLKTLGTAGRDQLDTRSMLPVTANFFSVTRSLITEIRRGSVIAVMADAPLAREVLVTEFLGREVHLPAIVPRLIQAYTLPSFWCCPLWRGDRAIIEIERLPTSLPDEPPASWTNRWFSAYLAKVEKVMRGAPENLGLYSGIWANVDQSVVQARQRRPPISRKL